MAEAKKDENKVATDAANEISGFYLIGDRTSDATPSPKQRATEEDQTIADLPEVDSSELVEEPTDERTDELSALLSERVEGDVDHRAPLFIPKIPTPDAELVALAKSIESHYEQNQKEWTDGSAGNSHFDFTRLSRSTSMLPPPKKTFSWLRVGSLAAVVVVIALTGAAGGWYAALSSTHTASSITSPTALPSAIQSALRTRQTSLENLDTTRPIPLQSVPESQERSAMTEPVDLLSLTEQPSVDDRISNPRSGVEQPRDTFNRRGSQSETSPTERSSVGTTVSAIAAAANKTDISPSKSPEATPAISPSDQIKNESAESIETENSISTRTNEIAETNIATETNVNSVHDDALSLPEMLTREQVAEGFKSIYQQISECAAGKHGTAKIKATLSGKGRVMFALEDGAFRGSKEGSCMARAVRKTTFPEFTQSKLTVEFPYVL